MTAFLFDMDGVLYNSTTPIPGAAETLAWVRAQSIPHLFVTNTTSRGRERLVEKLAGFGIAASCEDILTPTGCAPPAPARSRSSSGPPRAASSPAWTRYPTTPKTAHRTW